MKDLLQFTLYIQIIGGVYGLFLAFLLWRLPDEKTFANTILPENWQHLRRQWEYSHAVGAGLYFIALCSFVIAMLIK